MPRSEDAAHAPGAAAIALALAATACALALALAACGGSSSRARSAGSAGASPAVARTAGAGTDVPASQTSPGGATPESSEVRSLIDLGRPIYCAAPRGTQEALTRSTGGPVFLFRPPYGARDPAIDSIVRAHGLLQILWTVDSADSLGANYAQIEHNVIGGLRGGAIILMHENHGQTVRALPNIFGALRAKHLRAVSVPQLLTDDPPSVAQVLGGGAACGIHGRAAVSGG